MKVLDKNGKEMPDPSEVADMVNDKSKINLISESDMIKALEKVNAKNLKIRKSFLPLNYKTNKRVTF